MRKLDYVCHGVYRVLTVQMSKSKSIRPIQYIAIFANARSEENIENQHKLKIKIFQGCKGGDLSGRWNITIIEPREFN